MKYMGLMLAAAACAAPAIAATPIISGNYIFVSRTFCQPTLTLNYANDQNGQTFVNGVNLTAPEDTAHEVGQASFDSSNQTVTFNSFKDHGSNVLLQTSGGLQGSVIAEKTNSGSVGYSNTATTVTLNGATFNATYGKQAKGVSAGFALVGLDAAGCTEEWNFTQQ
ncbi:MAG: hypothetical protein ABSD74_06650 [Rhizomicrobium sp.]|jgi:hypothetical protein